MRLDQLGERDGWTCWLCGAGVDRDVPRGSPGAASADHVVPRARGGRSDPENLRLAHRRCNGARGSRLPELEWPATLAVLDAAPVWTAVRRALRRPGEWELVAVLATPALAEDAAGWLEKAVATVLGPGFEVRRREDGPLPVLDLRARPEGAPPRHRGNRRPRERGSGPGQGAAAGR